MLLYPLKSNESIEQDVLLGFLRKGTAGYYLYPTSFWLCRGRQKVLHTSLLLGVIYSNGERESKIIHPRRHDCNKMGTSAHENIVIRIGIRIRNIANKLH